MKSIYFRNFAATAATVFLCMLIIAFSMVFIVRSFSISAYLTNMGKEAAEVSRLASAVADKESLDDWAISMLLCAVSGSTGDDIIVTDTDGCVLSCSDELPDCTHIGCFLPADAVSRLAETHLALTPIDFGEIYATNVYACCEHITDSAGETIGYVFVSNVPNRVIQNWGGPATLLLIISGGVFAIALLATFVYSKRMARPLDEMAAASRKFARGDFSVRVKQIEEPESEMGALIEAFNKMADSLESSEKRRSEFIGNISHELRTPMTSISGFADGILDGTIPKEEEEKYLISIRDETRRLSRLVRDMLDAAQQRARTAEGGNRTVFDITELSLQTLLSFESRAVKKGLDVDPQLPDNNIMVKADKDAITRVIYNLLDNAVKFAAQDSCITLRIYKDNGKAYVSIKDCGETIPPDDLPYIFDRFHKSDRSRSLDKDGVGLGLYLVKEIINSHDEDIAVRSENGVTEFVFTLPLAE